MSSVFDVKICGIPNEDLVLGFPGVKASWPRIEATVEVRSQDPAATLQVSLVTIALYRTDLVHLPSNKPGISGPKREESYLVGDKLTLFQATAGKPFEEVLGLDLPFILPLPSNRPLPGSLAVDRASVETSYRLFVSIVHGSGKQQQAPLHVQFPIRIKRYDTLSTFGAYRAPVVNSVSSSDHLVTLDYSIQGSSFGPRDSINAFIKVAPNPDWSRSKKVKLQRVTMQLVEVITYSHEGDDPVERRRQLCKTTHVVEDKLPETGHLCELMLQVPSYADAAAQPSTTPIAGSLPGISNLTSSTGQNVLPKERQEIPTACRTGFSTVASLYKVEYRVIFKARFSHCKDIEAEQVVTISPFDHAMCVSFMKSIGDAVEYANRVGPVHPSMQASPRVYKSDPQSLAQLGRILGPKGYSIVVS